jgi:hypothetical protein
MIENGKYGNIVISCIASNGICHNNQECSTCFYAERYEFRKKIFDLAEKCDLKDGMNCTRFEKECKAEECQIILCKIELLN